VSGYKIKPGANLAHAYLAVARLTGANLWSPRLTGANLADANLKGADLAGAADLTGAIMPDGTKHD